MPWPMLASTLCCLSNTSTCRNSLSETNSRSLSSNRQPGDQPEARLHAVLDQLDGLGFRVVDEDRQHLRVGDVHATLGIHSHTVGGHQLEEQLLVSAECRPLSHRPGDPSIRPSLAAAVLSSRFSPKNWLEILNARNRRRIRPHDLGVVQHVERIGIFLRRQEPPASCPSPGAKLAPASRARTTQTSATLTLLRRTEFEATSNIVTILTAEVQWSCDTYHKMPYLLPDLSPAGSAAPKSAAGDRSRNSVQS